MVKALSQTTRSASERRLWREERHHIELWSKALERPDRRQRSAVGRDHQGGIESFENAIFKK
jgi:hypothetical protein